MQSTCSPFINTVIYELLYEVLQIDQTQTVREQV